MFNTERFRTSCLFRRPLARAQDARPVNHLNHPVRFNLRVTDPAVLRRHIHDYPLARHRSRAPSKPPRPHLAGRLWRHRRGKHETICLARWAFPPGYGIFGVRGIYRTLGLPRKRLAGFAARASALGLGCRQQFGRIIALSTPRWYPDPPRPY